MKRINRILQQATSGPWFLWRTKPSAQLKERNKPSASLIMRLIARLTTVLRWCIMSLWSVNLFKSVNLSVKTKIHSLLIQRVGFEPVNLFEFVNRLGQRIFLSEPRFTRFLFGESVNQWESSEPRFTPFSLVFEGFFSIRSEITIQWVRFWISKSFHQTWDSLPSHSVSRLLMSDFFFFYEWILLSEPRFTSLSFGVSFSFELVNYFWISKSFGQNWDSLPYHSVFDQLIFLSQWS